LEGGNLPPSQATEDRQHGRHEHPIATEAFEQLGRLPDVVRRKLLVIYFPDDVVVIVTGVPRAGRDGDEQHVAAYLATAKTKEPDEQLADEIEGGNTGFLIERALDEARSRQFRPIG
jgi:hypothetical protein